MRIRTYSITNRICLGLLLFSLEFSYGATPSDPVSNSAVGSFAAQVSSTFNNKESKGPWVGAGMLYLPLFRANDGKKFEIGYRKNKFGIDLRGLWLKSTYSRFAVSPDNPPDPPEQQYDENGDPIPFPPPENQSQDSWGGTIYDIGLSYITTPSFVLGSRFQERTRVGLCVLGRIRDEVNSVAYRPSLFSLESDIEYFIFKKLPLKVQLGLNWRFGYLVISDPVERMGNRIPSSSVSLNTGIIFEF